MKNIFAQSADGITKLKSTETIIALAIGGGSGDISNDDLNPVSLVGRNGGGSGCIFGPGA